MCKPPETAGLRALSSNFQLLLYIISAHGCANHARLFCCLEELRRNSIRPQTASIVLVKVCVICMIPCTAVCCTTAATLLLSDIFPLPVGPITKVARTRRALSIERRCCYTSYICMHLRSFRVGYACLITRFQKQRTSSVYSSSTKMACPNLLLSASS